MKMIISESKMISAVTKWLDKKYGNLTKIPHSVFTTFADESGDAMFFYDNESGDVTIENEDLQYGLFDMFNLSSHGLKTILKPWIEETYGIDVDLVHYTTYYCGWCNQYHPTKYHID